MSANEWSQLAEELRENLVDIERMAKNVSVQMTELCRTWESLK